MVKSILPGGADVEDAASQRVRLLTFAQRLTALVVAFALFYLVAATVMANARLAVTGVVISLDVPLLVFAMSRARKGDLTVAAGVVGFGILGVAVGVTLLVPKAYASMVLATIMAVASVLPYLRAAALRRFVVVSFATTIAITTIAHFSPRPALSPAVALTTVVGATSAAAYLVLVLLFQFSTRLRHTLETTVAANLALTRARESERRVKERLAFLARSSETLAASLDYDELVTKAAELAVPFLADLCIVDILDESGRVQRVTSHHPPGLNADALRDLERRCPADWNSKDVSRILGTARPVLLAEISSSIAALDIRAARRDIMSGGHGPNAAADIAGSRSYLAVPLVARDRILGVFFFGLAESGRVYDESDVSFAHELARRAATAIENARLYREAQDANRLKDEFLATLSHELRTPLQAIFGWSHILRRRAPDAAMIEKGLAIVERSARAQEKLIDDLLDISRVMAGKIVLKPTPIAPGEVLKAAVEAVRPMAQGRRIEIDASAEEGLGPVMADGDRLQQVVWNLLTNAVKFTPAGGRVEARARRRGPNVEIRVTDNGEGISPEFLPYVFDRFRQADSSSTRRHGGLGIGLAIVRQLVELHGGSVVAESDGHGAGTTLRVLLPMPESLASEVTLPESSGRHRAAGAAERLRGLRVLVVDDEADTRELLLVLLTGEGAEVRVAASAAEGLARIEEEPPNLLVSDIGIPGEDGYAFLAKARAITHARRVWMPAIAVTAYAGADNVARALRGGFQIHMTKPVHPQELLDAVARLANRRPIPIREASPVQHISGRTMGSL